MIRLKLLFSVFLLSVAGLGISRLRTIYQQNEVYLRKATCRLMDSAITTQLCSLWDHQSICPLHTVTYILMNASGMTPYVLYATKNLATGVEDENWLHCPGRSECPCYYDERDIWSTLSFSSAFFEQNLLIVFTLGLGFFIFLYMLWSFSC